MSNRAYLLNLSIQSSDPQFIEAQLAKPGQDFLELGAAAYRVPIPWLCCFRREHLVPVEVGLDPDDVSTDGVPAVFSHAQFPCCTVEQARANLEQSLPLFESIAGDKDVGRAFWQHAARQLKEAPLPFLTMDVVEVMNMSEPKTFQAQLEGALAGDASSIPHLQELASFEVGVRPYRPDVLYAVAGPNLDKRRASNATALDFQASGMWHLSAGSTRTRDAASVGFVDDGVNFVSALGEMENLLKAKVSRGRVFLGFMPVRPGDGEHLKALISTETDAERQAVVGDREFRSALDRVAQPRMQDLCHLHGFTFAGFVFRSTESVARRFKGDWDIYNDWVTEPAEPPFAKSSSNALWRRFRRWMASS